VPLRLQASVDVRAPATIVFDLLCTPERLPEWNTSVETVRRVDPGEPVTLGSRCLMTGKLLGQTLESETEVVVFEPPRAFATQARRGPRLLTRFRVESQPFGSRVDADVSGEVPGGRIGSMLAEGFLKRELSVSLEHLKAICERAAREQAAAAPAEGGDPACWLHLTEPNDD
jgi:uncharacterized protein YndB with AHSA1/START domain